MAKTAIVTGGSGGIGKGIAERLAKDGFSIVLTYSGNPDKAKEVASAIKSSGGNAISVGVDVSKIEDVKNLFQRAISEFGAIDVVVNTAGIMPLSTIQEGDVESFDKVIATNLRGTFLVLSEAAKHVVKGGRIIAFSSSVLAKSFPSYGPYIASKAGVEGLVKVLANELRGREITVNAVAPGPVATDLFLKGKSSEQLATLAKMAPLERVGQVEDIAQAVSFLSGKDGAWINAQVLRVNGGFA